MLFPSFFLARAPSSSSLRTYESRAHDLCLNLLTTQQTQIAVAKALVNVRTQLTLRNAGDAGAVDAAVVCVEPVLAPKLAFIEVSFLFLLRSDGEVPWLFVSQK